MPYIAFLDLTGTRASASISNDEYTDVIKDFHYSLKHAGSLCECNIYGYSDNAYIEIKELDDMIMFFRVLRKRLMQKHRYFSAAVDSGSLNADRLPIGKNKGFSMMFTAPKVINLYLKQSRFSGIGISLSERVVEELNSDKRDGSFCSSVFQRIAPDGTRYMETNYKKSRL